MKVFYTSFLFISLLFLFSVCQTLQVYHGKEDVDFALESIKYWKKRYEMYSFMFILFILFVCEEEKFEIFGAETQPLRNKTFFFYNFKNQAAMNYFKLKPIKRLGILYF